LSPANKQLVWDVRIVSLLLLLLLSLLLQTAAGVHCHGAVDAAVPRGAASDWIQAAPD
jgi:hypothetical protein